MSSANSNAPSIVAGGPAARVAGLRRRNVASSGAGNAAAARRPAAGVGPRGTANMMRIYTDDSPGIKIDPVFVLVFSLAFISSVFLLHIIGKLVRV